ncbi:MAG: 5-amino-6-(D-ribitylamino)uracil--L-tyrosine 4-hydroxyphenyl transferase CofH [Magnetovibrionaceae bacterium]
MTPPFLHALLMEAQAGRLSTRSARKLADIREPQPLLDTAYGLARQGFGDRVTFSPKVFIPLTRLCRDHCHYCLFAQSPSQVDSAYLSEAQVLDIARKGAEAGCREALFTLGDRPEARYRAAGEALASMGFASTVDYLAHVARRVFDETGLLVHINAGILSQGELSRLRSVAPSMGLMLESASKRLMEPGNPHHGSPDKDPEARLACLAEAGRQRIPMTSGILIGIGETRIERIESLLALRELAEKFGHIQEVIVQNFRAKPKTRMAARPEPDLEDQLWTLAVARLILGPDISIQTPPNLRRDDLGSLLSAGINDWGGISPITPDHVNPEAPWPQVAELKAAVSDSGLVLAPRLPVYPRYIQERSTWMAPEIATAVLRGTDGEGLAREDELGQAAWSPGVTAAPPPLPRRLSAPGLQTSSSLGPILDRAESGKDLSEADVVRLLTARGPSFAELCQTADRLRQSVNGDTVTYVVNRNINYTNVCGYRCQFCAFSKGKLSENLRGEPFDLDPAEITRRSAEAWARGATEVCLQGGIHPDYTGQTYLDILDAVRKGAPDIHIHAFSPLEVTQGAKTLGLSLADYLGALKEAGLGSLPGTAAEVLDDSVRAVLCPDKINTAQWLDVMRTAHGLGIRSTSTLMFGHIEEPLNIARHLLALRDLQRDTGGFSEFVPLPFVHMEAPNFLKGNARKGPTYREAVGIHAVSRLVFSGRIDNIQTSWVKMGPEGAAAALSAGVNDLGGTLMNETISRAAGTAHGQEMAPERLEDLLIRLGRAPQQRTTLYGTVSEERIAASFRAQPLVTPSYSRAGKYARHRSKAAHKPPGS